MPVEPSHISFTFLAINNTNMATVGSLTMSSSLRPIAVDTASTCPSHLTLPTTGMDCYFFLLKGPPADGTDAPQP
jgi:hypothetical protein